MGAFDSPPTGSYWLPIDMCGLSLTVFELFFSCFRKTFPSVRPSEPDTIMTITAREAIAWSSGKNEFHKARHVALARLTSGDMGEVFPEDVTDERRCTLHHGVVSLVEQFTSGAVAEQVDVDTVDVETVDGETQPCDNMLRRPQARICRAQWQHCKMRRAKIHPKAPHT